MQNTVKKVETIRMGSGILKINNVDVGAINGASINATFLVSQVKFKNAELPPRKKLDNIIFTAEIVELYLNTLNTIFGGELTLVPEVPAEMDGETVVTPAIPARKVLTFDDLIHLIATYPVEFVNTDENGKKFGIKIFEGYSSSALNFDFGDDNDLESFSSISVEFTGLADENGKKFEIFDEQGVYLVS